jgi:hypothetical protein
MVISKRRDLYLPQGFAFIVVMYNLTEIMNFGNIYGFKFCSENIGAGDF